MSSQDPRERALAAVVADCVDVALDLHGTHAVDATQGHQAALVHRADDDPDHVVLTVDLHADDAQRRGDTPEVRLVRYADAHRDARHDPIPPMCPSGTMTERGRTAMPDRTPGADDFKGTLTGVAHTCRETSDTMWRGPMRDTGTTHRTTGHATTREIR